MMSEAHQDNQELLSKGSLDSAAPRFILISKSNSVDVDEIVIDRHDSGFVQGPKTNNDGLNEMINNLGEKDPDVIFLLETLGNGCFKNEDYNDALRYYRQALDLKMQTLGQEHPD
eukprot:5496717-Ditylum_brightwellii.AAC.1